MIIDNENILNTFFINDNFNNENLLFDKQGKLWINYYDLILNNNESTIDVNNHHHHHHHQQQQNDVKKFQQYFCRLRGNSLYIIFIDDMSDEIEDKELYLIVLSKNFSIKLCDTITNDNDIKLYEFCLLSNKNSKTNSNDKKSIKYYFASETIVDRDNWIKLIYLSSFDFLNNLRLTLENDYQLKRQTQQKQPIANINDNQFLINNEKQKIFHTIIRCDNIKLICNNTSLKFFIKLYSKNSSNTNWFYCGETEIIESNSPQFINAIKIIINNDDEEIELKFELHNCIDSYLPIELLYAYGCKNFDPTQLNDFENILNKNYTIRLKKTNTNIFIGQLTFRMIYDDQKCQNIMSHQTLQKNLPLFNEPIIKRSFFIQNQFSNFQHIICEESTDDSKYVFLIPLYLLRSYINDEKFLLNSLKQSKFIDLQTNFLDFQIQNIEIFENVYNEIDKFMISNTFRPSTMKKELFLQFIPMNFHRQLFHVETNDGEKSKQLKIYTFGVHACHHYGFEKYNWKLSIIMNLLSTNNQKKSIDEFIQVEETWKLYRKLLKLSHNEKIIIDLLNNLNETLENINVHQDYSKVEKIYQQIQLNAEELIDLIENYVCETYLTQMNQIMYEMNNIDNFIEEFQLEPIDLIYLNIKACFVDINDKLKHQKAKINEFEPCNRKLRMAIESLKNIIISCYLCSFLQLKSSNDLEQLQQMNFRYLSLIIQAITTIIIIINDNLLSLNDENLLKFLMNAKNTGHIIILYETLLSCFSEEIGMLEDMIFAIDTIANITKLKFCFITIENDYNEIRLPEIDFNLNQIQLKFYLNQSKFENHFKNEEIIECRLLPLIFNIGVNQQASLPNNIFKKSLQEEINSFSFEKLKNFIEKYYNNDHAIERLLQNLDNELNHNNQKIKNIKILQLTNELIRLLNDDYSLKITCCKSAKDRTGMSVTLEQVRFAFKHLRLNRESNEQLFQTMLDTFRRDGTRMAIVEKNIGAKKYAFNYLYLLTFPYEYRPPLGTYSSIVDT